jgi:hypothetical protein
MPLTRNVRVCTANVRVGTVQDYSDLTDLRRTNSDSRCGVTVEIIPTDTSSVQHVGLLTVYDKMATLVRFVSSIFPGKCIMIL